MKKVLLFAAAMVMSCTLAGCYVAPNVPGVTQYASPGTYSTTTPGAYGNYVGRGNYGNYTGRMYRNNVGRGKIGNNKTGGNIPANGRAPAYVPGSQSYGLR